MNQHFIFGCGFLGYRLARAFQEKRQPVWTVTRSESKAQRLQGEGIQALVADSDDWQMLAENNDLPQFHTITVCIGNDAGPTNSHTDIYTRATRAALALAKPSRSADKICQIFFVSTTGVYSSEPLSRSGSAQGSSIDECPWMDEHWPLAPTRPGSLASLHCEELLQKHALTDFCIFRLAGIYSYDRIPNLAKLQAGQPIPGSGHGLLNLIHVADAAAILAHAAINPPPWSIINVADGHPVVRQEFYEFLTRQWDLPAPQFGETAGRGSNKRIDVTRLRQWYQQPWLFPNYQVGLAESG